MFYCFSFSYASVVNLTSKRCMLCVIFTDCKRLTQTAWFNVSRPKNCISAYNVYL